MEHESFAAVRVDIHENLDLSIRLRVWVADVAPDIAFIELLAVEPVFVVGVDDRVNLVLARDVMLAT